MSGIGAGEWAVFYHSYSVAALLYEVQAAVASVLFRFKSEFASLPRLLWAPFEHIPTAHRMLEEVNCGHGLNHCLNHCLSHCLIRCISHCISHWLISGCWLVSQVGGQRSQSRVPRSWFVRSDRFAGPRLGGACTVWLERVRQWHAGSSKELLPDGI